MPEEESLIFELPPEFEALDIQQVGEADIQKIAVETLKSRTERHNAKVLQQAEELEDSAKASFIRRKFVVGIKKGSLRVDEPGTAYKKVVNGQVIDTVTKGYTVACNWVYAGGRVSQDIHMSLDI